MAVPLSFQFLWGDVLIHSWSDFQLHVLIHYFCARERAIQGMRSTSQFLAESQQGFLIEGPIWGGGGESHCQGYLISEGNRYLVVVEDLYVIGPRIYSESKIQY